MDSQYEKNKCLFLDNNRNFLKEIINIEKFRDLDRRYMVVDICREMNLKYDFKNDDCSVYSKSFVSNISFNGLNLKSITCFVYQEFLDDIDQRKFVSFLRHLVKDYDLNISFEYLNGILNSGVKEFKNETDKCEFYLRKIIRDDRELFFVMINIKRLVD